MKKIDLKPIGEFAKGVGKIVSFGALVGLYYKLGDMVAGSGTSIVGYSDAVKAIMNSNMFSGDKSQAVSVLKRYDSSEFYKAIISIANDSSVFSGDKVRMIKQLCED